MAVCSSCGTEILEEAVFCVICGAPAPPPTIPGTPISVAVEPAKLPDPPPPARGLLPGALVDNKYAVDRVLGEGGMGVVYLARDVNTGREVVVKSVKPELTHRDDVRARTLEEARALASIDHPNVVVLNAVVTDGDALYLVMQFIDGESLDKRIKRLVDAGQRMPVGEALSIFKQVVLGVGAAHKEGIIHRDLKPANVLLRARDGVAKVTDFGIAKAMPEAQDAARGGSAPLREATKGVLGSLWYMSPEQVTGRRDLDTRVDIYALGILLYQMLAGRVPFTAKSEYELMKMQATAPMPRVLAARDDVPPGIDEVIQRCCAKDRGERFARVEDLLLALDAIGAPPAVSPTQPASARPPRPARRRSRALLVIALLVLVAAASAVGLVVYDVVPNPLDPPKKAAPIPTAKASAR